MASIIEIEGIDPSHAEKLREVGICSLLYESLVRTNEAKKLVRKMPTIDQVAEWIVQAKTLPRVIEY